MCEPPSWAKILTIITALVLMALIVDLLFGGGAEQIKRVQKARTDFAEDCVSQNGTLVRNSKGSPSILCFSADGRLLGSY